MSPLERQLSASIDFVRESKRQKSDLDEWLEAAPVPVRKPKMTVTAIERTNGETLVVHRDVSGPLEFTPQQSQMIRDTYANGASEKEFQVLLEIAKTRRLNPLLKQVHFVKRKNKQLGRDVWSAQVSIDGLRAIAERTGKYDGQDEPEYGYDKDGLIISCRVRVYRKDWSRPAVGIAHWTEYVQGYDGKPTKFWADMPHVMIAKCAEAVAMRKAFPEDMGGLYVDEEMMQADNGQLADNGTAGAFSAHVAPGEDPEAAGDADLFRDLCGRFSKLEGDLEQCDSWDKCNALRGLLGTRAKQSDLTRTMQQKAEAGDISPTQRAELGKTWMRANRELEKLEKKLTPPIEATFEPERQPGEDDPDEL